MNESAVQRVLSEEFENAGAQYDLSVCRTLAISICGDSAPSVADLMKLIPRHSSIRRSIGDPQLEMLLHRVCRRAAKEDLPMDDSTRGELRLLFMTADPTDQNRLRLDAEHRDIVSRLRSATLRDRISVETSLASRPKDLIDTLNRVRPQILHISCHGDSLGLAFEDDRGATADLSDENLATAIELAAQPIDLVVLNSCSSADIAKRVAAVGPAAVGMLRSIGDEAAREYAAQLYSSLAEGVPTSKAHRQACAQVRLLGLPDADLPDIENVAGAARLDGRLKR